MTGQDAQGVAPPLVTVVMANFRGAQYIEAAIRSVLRQTHGAIELIVSDDASDDESCAIVRQIAASDPRVQLIEAHAHRGPSHARNAALDAAQGEWIAIVDSDDLVHPCRLALMLDAAIRWDADMVADDMMPFGTASATANGTLYGAITAHGPREISAVDLVTSDWPGSPSAPLGYVKPLIRSATLGLLRYDDALRNSEDFDLYLRLLLGGARFLLLPQPTYLYRRHAASISHRLSVDVLQPLLDAHDRLTVEFSSAGPEIASVLAERRKKLIRSLRYARLVAALKSRDVARTSSELLRHPCLVADLAESLRDRKRRQRARPSANMGDLTADRIVLASPDDARLAATVGRRVPVEATGVCADDTALAVELCRLHARAAPDVTVIGLAGLRALGYLPGWRNLSVVLAPEEVSSGAALLPDGVTPEIAPIHQPSSASSSR